MKFFLINIALIAAAFASPTQRVVQPGIIGPTPVELEPIVTGPTLVDSYEPIAVGPSLIDSYEPISVGPAIVDPDVAAPSNNVPLVTIILNINAATGQVSVGSPAVDSTPETVSVVESAPETVSVVESAPDVVSIVEFAPESVVVDNNKPEPIAVGPVLLENEYEEVQVGPALVEQDSSSDGVTNNILIQNNFVYQKNFFILSLIKGVAKVGPADVVALPEVMDDGHIVTVPIVVGPNEV